MEANKILESLSELERTLAQIDSAKKQVEQTVAAYSNIGVQFNGYSKDLNDVTKNINEVIAFVKLNRETLTTDINGIFDEKFSRLDQIISDFNKSVGYTQDNFKKDSDTLIYEVGQNNEKIKSKFDNSIDNTASGFNDRVTQNMEELSQLAKTMSQVLEEYKAINKEFETKLEIALEPIREDLKYLKQKASKNEILSYVAIGFIVIVGILVIVIK
ncbi:MAG: hypothetical protein SNI45_06390 [Rikenellaceae bacterium]